MSKILVLADDLTGANDTGAAIRKRGWKTFSVVSCDAPPLRHSADCICVNMDSRNELPETAYHRVRQSVSKYASEDTVIFSKRIDSTLRGNLGAECDAMLDSVCPDGVALVVPAFPRAGRTYINGNVYVNGVLLKDTAVAKDPKWPMTDSSALAIFRAQSKFSTECIPIHTVRLGVAALYEEIEAQIENGVKNILFEAETSEDLLLIAQAAARLKSPFIAVDPGEFTAALVDVCLGMPSQKFGDPAYIHGGRILAVIGSINAAAKEQTRYLLSKENVFPIVLDVEAVLRDEEAREKECVRVADELRDVRKTPGFTLLLFSSSMPDQEVSLESYCFRDNLAKEEISRNINTILANLAAEELTHGYGGAYTSGGDITLSVCRALGCEYIQVQEEIIPLAVGGVLYTPELGNLAVATKGGMVGGKTDAAFCMEYLQNILKGEKKCHE